MLLDDERMLSKDDSIFFTRMIYVSMWCCTSLIIRDCSSANDFILAWDCCNLSLMSYIDLFLSLISFSRSSLSFCRSSLSSCDVNNSRLRYAIWFINLTHSSHCLFKLLFVLSLLVVIFICPFSPFSIFPIIPSSCFIFKFALLSNINNSFADFCVFATTLFFMSFALCPNLNVDNDSLAFDIFGEHVTIKVVWLLPPRLSWRTRVSLLSL